MQCLDENAMLDLFRGRLSPERVAQVQTHIDECEDCRVLVAEVARQPFSRAHRAGPDADDTQELADARTPSAPPPHAAPASPAVHAGMVIGERYRLDHMLGEGGVGVVWAATHVATGSQVALKLLKSREPEIIKRFAREVQVTAALAHPGIVEVHDVLALGDGTSVMVMDLLRGESLGRRLARGSLALGEARALLLPVISTVGTAHAAGIVHRDLKPENVFLAATGVKVLDFGLAKLMDGGGMSAGTRLTRSGFVLGTPHYMAPEQVFADREIDHRADVWSLGVILYECLAGARPIQGKSLGAIFRAITRGTVRPLTDAAPHVPPPVGALVGRMMSLDKALRPDLREVFDVLSP